MNDDYSLLTRMVARHLLLAEVVAIGQGVTRDEVLQQQELLAIEQEDKLRQQEIDEH